MAANVTQILNFKANFHQEFELFKKKYANKLSNNGEDFKIVSIIKKPIKFVHIRPYNFKKYLVNSTFKWSASQFTIYYSKGK